MSVEEKAFEGWAILELMGHRRLAGYVQETQLAGHGFIRLDIPEVAGDESLPAATQFYSPASVYAITPTTEETARRVRWRPAPVQTWELPRPAEVEPAREGDIVDEDELDDLGELF